MGKWERQQIVALGKTRVLFTLPLEWSEENEVLFSLPQNGCEDFLFSIPKYGRENKVFYLLFYTCI